MVYNIKIKRSENVPVEKTVEVEDAEKPSETKTVTYETYEWQDKDEKIVSIPKNPAALALAQRLVGYNGFNKDLIVPTLVGGEVIMRKGGHDANIAFTVEIVSSADDEGDSGDVGDARICHECNTINFDCEAHHERVECKTIFKCSNCGAILAILRK